MSWSLLAVGSALLDIAIALIALYLAIQCLGILDKRSGFEFRKWVALADEANAPPSLHLSRGIYLAGRIIAVALVIGLTLGCGSAAAAIFPERYDAEIEAASSRWLPELDWRLWKAQLYQESRLDPAAKSHVGAAGVAQFMPRTWLDVSRALGYDRAVSPHMAGPAIVAGAFYMAQQRAFWRRYVRADFALHDHALCSYNAGAGNCRKAWRLADEPQSWDVTAASLGDVTGRHAKETRTYVERIWRWFSMMT